MGAMVGTVFSSAVVFAWTDPTQVPPNGNVFAPLNVGSLDQVKSAGLGVDSLAVFGNSILSGASRYLNFGTLSGTTGYGIRDNAGTLEFKHSGGSWAAMAAGVVSETDPQVGTLTNGRWCTNNGTSINCTSLAPVLTEADPSVGTLTNGKWCTTNGTVITCTSNAPVTVDPIFRLSSCSSTSANCSPPCPAGYTLINSLANGSSYNGFTTSYSYIGICGN